MSKFRHTSQGLRLTYLITYVAFLFLMNWLAFGQWLPLTTSKGLWFYSGAAALILGSLLITPFFTSPANAISYLIAALIAVLAYQAPSTDLVDTLPRTSVIIFCFLMLVACVLNIFFKDSTYRQARNVSEVGRLLAESIGNPRFVYALIIVYALWEYHRESPVELFFIGFSGIVIAAHRPLETFGDLIKRIQSVWIHRKDATIIGSVVAHQTPDLLLIRQDGTETVSPGTCLLVSDAHAPLTTAVVLGYSGRDEGLLIRALEIKVPDQRHSHLIEVAKRLPDGSVSIIDQANILSFREDVGLLKNYESFIGLVAQDTCIEKLLFEVVHEREIEHGRLIEAFVGGRRVLYQILDGLTKEDIVQQKNTYGFARGEALQVGIWDEKERKFKPCNWIPKINEPVFLKTVEASVENVNAVGHFPGTSYDVEISNINGLVTHNTAILGILGVGKSMLAIELVERMIAGGIKVICLDLTNQYRELLKDFIDARKDGTRFKSLQQVGQGGKVAYQSNVEEGGSKKKFSEEMLKSIKEFVTTDRHGLWIINPAQFEVWKQTSNLFKPTDRPNMVILTPTEITQIISESCLEVVQGLGMSDGARVCLVYEEAHSLIPEWTSVAAEGDKAATNGTSRAILQGRKFGLGCLLITQRTANVTKTILNQCNTIFAMRTFDDTGKEFLSNYIGGKHASKLSTLKERHAIFFGRGSSCENPVMIRLNDQDKFREVFRKSFPPPTPPVMRVT